MRRLDTRAIENIASAPATGYDRRNAAVLALVFLLALAATVPFARVPFPAVPAFLPLSVGAAILALLLTSVLLYVQYRIARDTKLALLALAYAWLAASETTYVLAFPGIFAPQGILGGPRTAAGFLILGQLGFAALAILHGLASRRAWRLARLPVRALASIAALVFVLAALLIGFGRMLIPDAALIGTNAELARPVSPLMIAAMLVALMVVAQRLATVTQVWVSVVLFAKIVEIVTASTLSAGRYSGGWYVARLEDVACAVILLAVFLVKINDLMLRLALRSRSTAEALEVGEARYASLANVVPQLIWTANAEGDIEYVNDRWVAYTGRDINATRDLGWRDAVQPDQEPQVRASWEASLASGEPFAAELRLRAGASGRYRWFLVNAVPVRGRRGEIVAWIGTCTDVDAQKRLEEREAFLARAGERLGASLDVTATVAAIRAAVIPVLAERSWVALLDDDGRYIVAGMGSTDLKEELDTRRWIGVPFQPALHDAVAAVVDGREPVILEAPDRFPDPWLRELPAGAAMIAPLVSGDVVIGALALGRRNARAYDADDVGLVRELARRAALSLDHARLYERERTTADALQRAMLPAQLPQLAEIRFSASYSAASESQRVGGDFYDAFELPDGRVALTIGDVTGHGLEAAVIMGEIRQGLRAASFESAEPAAILDRANRLFVASGRSVFVTAIFGILDPATGRFTYATAGHPSPLLAENGTVRRLPASGLPIGLRDDEGVDFAVRLHAPATLVFFTDGLIEFGRDLEAGERRIEAAVRTLAGEEIDHLAGALMKAVLGEDEPTDDVAILTVSVDRFASPVRGEEREWRFASRDARTGAMVRHELGELVARWTGRDDARFAAELAFGELIANAIRHAPGPVRVLAALGDAGDATITVEDTGAGFTGRDAVVEPLAESGRGLTLVKAVADDLRIEEGPAGGTRVRVAFSAAAAGARLAADRSA
ncbi:MAG TPA: SpoIIE family protein phosphatase [Candidatus Baltobacteraceae bacterium]|nr:SpoIIE family protein phosphatase [Candidatus Baltobacteraceae bacterium]